MDAPLQVLLATYNGERFVEEQLQSLLAQTYSDFEILASDDCSSDSTPDILQKYAKADQRVRILHSGRRFGGARDHFFWLLTQATSPYVAFSDQDDLWLSDKLALGMEKMEQLEKEHGATTPLLVFSDLAVAGEDLSVIHPSLYAYSGADPSRTKLPNLLAQNFVPGCVMLANRQLYHDVFTLPNEIEAVGMHDWWLILTASALGHIGYVDGATMLYRQHGHNSVGAHSGQATDIVRQLGSYASKLLPNSTQLDSIDLRLVQAAAFANAYADVLAPEDVQLCRELSTLLDRSPIDRVLWCHKHDVTNATLVMRLGLDWELLLYEAGRRHS